MSESPTFDSPHRSPRRAAIHVTPDAAASSPHPHDGAISPALLKHSQLLKLPPALERMPDEETGMLHASLALSRPHLSAISESEEDSGDAGADDGGLVAPGVLLARDFSEHVSCSSRSRSGGVTLAGISEADEEKDEDAEEEGGPVSSAPAVAEGGGDEESAAPVSDSGGKVAAVAAVDLEQSVAGATAVASLALLGIAGTGSGGVDAATREEAERVATARSVDASCRGSLAYLLAQPFARLEGVRLDELRTLRTLGVGTFGRVQLVEHVRSGDVYALKVLRKRRVRQHGQEANTLFERAVLGALQGRPFCLRLFATFQDARKLYLLTEFLPGGELFSLLGRPLPPAQARFYAGSVTLGLAAIHDLHVAFRDLKPENLLLDREGYLRIADFGFAKNLPPGARTFTVCGTPEYLAPEVIAGRGYGAGVDWYCLGVLVYEMLVGASPFADAGGAGGNLSIFRAILTQPPLTCIPARRGGSRASASVSAVEAAEELDFVRRLLCRDTIARLGCGRHGAAEVRAHPWLASHIDLAALEVHALPAPWRPAVTTKADARHFDKYSDSESDGEGHGGVMSGVARKECVACAGREVSAGAGIGHASDGRCSACTLISSGGSIGRGRTSSAAPCPWYDGF